MQTFLYSQVASSGDAPSYGFVAVREGRCLGAVPSVGVLADEENALVLAVSVLGVQTLAAHLRTWFGGESQRTRNSDVTREMVVALA